MGESTRLHQIKQNDLETLEKVLPEWGNLLAFSEMASPKIRTQYRVVQEIIANVRWGYGPPENVTKIPHGEGEPPMPM